MRSLFGRLTDMFGRKRLFMITLGVYLAATIATAFAWTPLFFFACRFVTGMGIGGEYSAINSAIDELIPAKHRGRIDILINGTYWAGAAAGALLSVAALHIFSPLLNWRVCFGLGVDPRDRDPDRPPPCAREPAVAVHPRSRGRGRGDHPGHRAPGRREHRRRARRPRRDDHHQAAQVDRPVGDLARDRRRRTRSGPSSASSLFIGQAFLYNAILFGYATLLSTFFGVSTSNAPYYLVAFAVGNLLGPIVLGPLFDTVGRKPMIAGTYILSGVLLLVTGYLFEENQLNATSLTIAGRSCSSSPRRASAPRT